MSLNGVSQILIADDHAGIREMVAAMIESMGHRPLTAESGEAAVEILGLGTIDLLITDLVLPDMDGLEVLRRSKELSPLTPVILVTGYPSVDKAIQAIKAGAIEFLTKPFKREVLERSVSRALEERRLIEENQRLMTEANKLAVIQRLNQRLNDKLRELMNHNRISEVIGSTEDNESLFRHVVDLAAELTGGQRVSLMLLTPDGAALTIRASLGLSEHVARETRVPLGSGIAGAVAETRTPLLVTRTNTVPAFPDRPAVYSSPSFICVPLVISGEVLGVLNVAERAGGGDFTAEEFTLMQSLAQKAAIRVENNALYESIYCNLVDTLTTLVSTIEAKDPYTKEHSKRVTQVAVAIARTMGLPDADIESIQFASLLHDIGKIAVRDSILLKPDRLTAAEFDVIKTHPVVGESIVEPLNLIPAERRIIRHHHERLDGSGYPDGLRGDQIHLLARIVAVADAYDAMTTTRVYRRAMGQAYALNEFERTRGVHYDPDILDALQAVLAAESPALCAAS
ncbi:MAG: response regulator [Candidatus Sumerlaeia bacterium]|nr:response regulator [Candidatus Sumerlaeia bacterium]